MMEQRKTARWQVAPSLLGFGAMRLPQTAEGTIDRERSDAMLRLAYESGVTYYDTAYTYHREESEPYLGSFLKGYDRTTFQVATKLPCWQVESLDDAKRIFADQANRIGVEYFDFYQLWDMSAPDHFETACIGPDTPLAAMREAKEQGLVKHLGFTTHNPIGDQVIDWLGQVPDFKFITVYYNFTDTAPEKVIDYAREHGVGVCIMGPLRGGLLVGESPAFERALPEFAGLPVQEIAIRFLLGNPGVATLISGMNEIEHMDQNARVASLEDPMTPEQRERFIQAFRDFTKGEPLCTGCRYCAGACPEHLPVWMMMPMYQLAEVFEVPSARKMVAKMVGSERMDPSKCIACGVCVEKCPQNLPIPERMEKLVDLSNAFKAELGEE